MAECLRSGDRLKNFPWPWGFQVVLIPETPTWWTGAMHSHRLQQQFWKWQPCRIWMLSFPCAAAADTMTLKQSFCHKHFVILLHIQLLVSRGIWKGSETWSITQKSKKIRYETFLLIGFRCKVHKVNLQSQSKAESYFFKAPRAYQIQRKAMGFYRKRAAHRLAVGASHGWLFSLISPSWKCDWAWAKSHWEIFLPESEWQITDGIYFNCLKSGWSPPIPLILFLLCFVIFSTILVPLFAIVHYFKMPERI